MDRPGLQEALLLLKRRQADRLVAYHSDRLSRHVGDLQHLLDKYFGVKSGKVLLSATEQTMETNTANGRIGLSMWTLFAQHQREITAEKVRAVMKDRKAKGYRVGAVPYGYALDPSDEDGKRLVAVPSEQTALVAMRKLRAKGLSYGEIAKRLNAAKVSSKRGGAWSPKVVMALLQRE